MAALGGNWGDDGEDDYLPPSQTTGPDANGIKTIIDWKFNDKNEKIRITRKVQVKRIQRKVSKMVARRKQWSKFGLAKDKGPPGTIDSAVTVQSNDEVFIENSNAPKKDSTEVFLEKLKEAKLQSVVGGGLRRGPRATDTEDAAGALGGAGRYVAPGLRGEGKSRGESMRGGRDDSATLRVTNLSEETREADVRELFSNYGRVTRVYLAVDRETKVSRGFAFVSFYSRQDAAVAMEKLQGYGYHHLILKIDWAEPSTRDPGQDNSMRYASGYGKALPQMSVKAATGGR